MKTILLTFILLTTLSLSASAQVVQSQNSISSVDSLKREVLSLKTDVETIKINLNKSKSKFRRGILVASLGYSITITGGLMLGRKQDDLGKVLLIAGGATGITGTALMLDAFRHLSP